MEILGFAVFFALMGTFLIIRFVLQPLTAKSKAIQIAGAFLEKAGLPDVESVSPARPPKHLRRLDEGCYWLHAGRSGGVDRWIAVGPLTGGTLTIMVPGYGHIGWNEKLVTVYRIDEPSGKLVGSPFVFNTKTREIKLSPEG